MIEVSCNLCKEKGTEVKLRSKVIAKSKEEEQALIGQEMLAHLQVVHPDKFCASAKGISGEIPLLCATFNGLMVAVLFDSEDEGYRKEKEIMRDRICEAVMLGAPEGEEFEDDFDDDDDSETEDEEETVAANPEALDNRQ